jgi:uncharacterized peroxidase-related enzyme
MAFIKLAELPELDCAPNHEKLFMIRPEVLKAWNELLSAIKKPQDLRTYELTTLAAARKLKSSYCCLAHGSVLAEQEMSMDDVVNIVNSGSSGVLSGKEHAMMQFAGNVADSASQITESDVNDLRSHGFSDPEIFDIAATAAARSFITKLMDSLGVQPDSHYASLPESVKGALVVGRPIEVSD